MRQTIILLAIVCALAYLSGAQAQCCRASLTLKYTIGRGTCADAGGHQSGNACTITICADGKAQVGTYCGRGSCNLFGCACRGGCISGNWQQSFQDLNRDRQVRVTDASWNS